MNKSKFEIQVDKIIKGLEEKKCDIIQRKLFEYGIQIDLIDHSFKQEKIYFFDSHQSIRMNYNRNNDFLHNTLMDLLSEHQIILSVENNRYIGIDESGKGDYLGPLVISGFISDRSIDKALIKMGVTDCKLLKDKRVIELAEELEENFQGAFTIFAYEPARYNIEYSVLKTQGLNMTEMLRQGQATVIERLLIRDKIINAVVADSISSFDTVMNSQLLNGRKLSVLHENNAERNPAVAAAGILARAYFLRWLKDKSIHYGVEMYKGANAKTIESCIKIIKSKNTKELKSIAKIHFKTTQIIMKTFSCEGVL